MSGTGSSPAVLANATTFVLNSVDCSGDLNQVDLAIKQASIDTSTFGVSGWKNFITSIGEATIKFAGFYNKASNSSRDTLFAMFGAPLVHTHWQLDIPSSAVGSFRYMGYCWATGETFTSAVNSALKVSGDLIVDGAVTSAIITS